MVPIDQTDLSRLRAYFSETILKRGWSYYMQGAVSKLEINGHRGQAVVLGSTSYRVQVDVQHVLGSTCTCPYDDFCKHMAAVLFEMLERTGQEPRALLAPQQKLALVPKRETHAVSYNTWRNQPQESDTVGEWMHKFDQLLDKPALWTPISFEVFFRQSRNELLPHAAHWAPEIRALYAVNVWMHLLEQIDEMYRTSRNQHLLDRFEVRKRIRYWVEELHHDLSTLQNPPFTMRYQTCLTDTIGYLRLAAFQQQETVADWGHFYRLFWGSVPVGEPVIKKEILRLRAEMGKLPLSSEQKQVTLHALIHLEILSGHDQQAMETAERDLPVLEMADLFSYLESFLAYEKWSRLQAWARWWKPYAKRLQQTDQYRYLDCWRSLKREGYADDKEWTDVLIDLLPISFTDYTHLLLQQKRCREWVDLHLWHETDPSMLRKDDLQDVADMDLPALLPLYHQAAERWIREKNRYAYKQAVKNLKKLKTCYRKLKQLPRWEQFIERFGLKYKRLTAFQEEARKGKLLP